MSCEAICWCEIGKVVGYLRKILKKLMHACRCSDVWREHVLFGETHVFWLMKKKFWGWWAWTPQFVGHLATLVTHLSAAKVLQLLSCASWKSWDVCLKVSVKKLADRKDLFLMQLVLGRQNKEFPWHSKGFSTFRGQRVLVFLRIHLSFFSDLESVVQFSEAFCNCWDIQEKIY